MAEEAGIDFDAENRGILHFHHAKDDFEAAGRVTELLRKGGLERQAVTPSEIRSIGPALKAKVYSGFYTPCDFTGGIHKLTHGLAQVCMRDGVTMRFSTEVLSAVASSYDVTVVSRSTGPRANCVQPPLPRRITSTRWWCAAA